MARLREISGLRGAAALAVVAFHANLLRPAHTQLGELASVGWIGVDFFFVLSAYLLGRPLIEAALRGDPPVHYARFVARRWLRIGPPFYIAIVVAIAVASQWSYARTHPGDLLLHLLYLHNATPSTFYSFNIVFWTLAVEFQFYLALPVLARLFALPRWPLVLLACLAVSVGWLSWTYSPVNAFHNIWLHGQLIAFLGHFALGLAIARLRAERVKLGAVPGLKLGPVAFVLVAGPLALYLPSHGPLTWPGTFLGYVFLRLLVASGFTSMILWATEPRSLAGRVLATEPLVTVGEASYSLYLMHLPVLVLLQRWLPTSWRLSLYLLVAGTAAILGSLVFHWLVERPVQRLKEKVPTVVPARSVPSPTAEAAPEAP